MPTTPQISPQRLTLLVTLGLLLVSAIGLVAITAFRPLPAPSLTTPLADLLPRQVEGWTVKDQPIAETEEMKKAVGELLNYDDAIFRTYTQGNTSIAVYVAYWKPGEMSPRLIAGHTPDVCWVGAGWKCTARDFAYRVNLPGKDIRTAQAGTYEISGNIQHVLLWHLHGNKLVSYKVGGPPPWWASLSDLWKEGLNQRGEQFFIRISSNLPTEDSLQTAPMRSAIEALGPVALYQAR
jgi:hypothetical protein